jgi:ABC-type uncharacterized transport system substrate-binding protein
MEMGNLYLHNTENVIRSQDKFYYLVWAEGKKANLRFRIQHYPMLIDDVHLSSHFRPRKCIAE